MRRTARQRIGGKPRTLARENLLARGSFGAIRQRVGSGSALFGGSEPASCPERCLQALHCLSYPQAAESTSLRSNELKHRVEIWNTDPRESKKNLGTEHDGGSSPSTD